MSEPHIVIFNPDQWRGDVLGHLGNPAALTPNLDKLVEREAVSFANVFCQNPVCTPSRCSFISGWYPHVRGHRTMHHLMHPDEPVLLKRLKDEGWFVYWGGKNDLVPGQVENPFVDYCNLHYTPQRPEGTAGDPPQSAWRGAPESDTYYSFYIGRIDCGDKPYWHVDQGYVGGALEVIRRRRELAGDRPLCLYLPLHSPHPPYGAPEPFFSAIERAKLPPRLPTPPGWGGKPAILKGIWKRQRLQTWDEAR